MFSLFKKKVSDDTVKAHLERICFLMKCLEKYGMQDKNQVVAAINKELLLAIPYEIIDPEGRIWPDPSNNNIAISFSCDDCEKMNRVKQFMMVGFNEMANTLIIGTAHQKDGRLVDFTWSINKESDARPVPLLSARIHQEFWKLPGFRKIGLGEFRFLQRAES